MTEKKTDNMTENDTAARIARARNFLCSYQLAAEMLELRRYERKRAKPFLEECDCDDLLAGNEAFWRARMFEVSSLLSGMKNGREKLILYYHYVRGESIEQAANLLGFSRRTGYRLHQKGLFAASFLLDRLKKNEQIDPFCE